MATSPAVDRARLRRTLRAAYPWVTDTETGPRAVEAGECDRCARRPRCVPTCGPVAWTALCADCAVAVGEDGWCAGHHDQGLAHRDWARSLPPEWATVVRLWWVATGEVRVDPAWVATARDEVVTSVGGILPRGRATPAGPDQG